MNWWWVLVGFGVLTAIGAGWLGWELQRPVTEQDEELGRVDEELEVLEGRAPAVEDPVPLAVVEYSLVMGYDAPYRTWFAQLYGPGAYDQDEPLRVMGFTTDDAAAAFTSGPQLGPTRVPTFMELRGLMTRLWGVSLR